MTTSLIRFPTFSALLAVTSMASMISWRRPDTGSDSGKVIFKDIRAGIIPVLGQSCAVMAKAAVPRHFQRPALHQRRRRRRYAVFRHWLACRRAGDNQQTLYAAPPARNVRLTHGKTRLPSRRFLPQVRPRRRYLRHLRRLGQALQHAA